MHRRIGMWQVIFTYAAVLLLAGVLQAQEPIVIDVPISPGPWSLDIGPRGGIPLLSLLFLLRRVIVAVFGVVIVARVPPAFNIQVV